MLEGGNCFVIVLLTVHFEFLSASQCMHAMHTVHACILPTLESTNAVMLFDYNTQNMMGNILKLWTLQSTSGMSNWQPAFVKVSSGVAMICGRRTLLTSKQDSKGGMSLTISCGVRFDYTLFLVQLLVGEKLPSHYVVSRLHHPL